MMKSLSSLSENLNSHSCLYLVFGGELLDVSCLDIKFRHLDQVDIVGIYSTKEEARAAWKERAQATVDNALMRYFVVPLHEFLNKQH